ncbi:hypothetical protein SAOR_01980 [Salinisphaera orenii MK-B5]|uniref:Membrane-binding protein n=1 Tax=Salinisphaera orenii MK-B5 TaxID=856730 RepID=A0A423PWH1_9GAMM|nr:hypothetical protein [Salinisphaera orenii]ROO29957.1 hypothetical protein SAOR_01980 [Salinisphaera orenii MK-B5]
MNRAIDRCALQTALVAGLTLQAAGAFAAQTYWLDDDFEAVAKANATHEAIVADERDGPGWPVEIRRIRYDQLHFRGYSSTPDLRDADQTWVGAYQLYRFAGDHRLEEVGTRNLAGERNGLAVGFSRDGDLAYETPYVDGVMQGMGRRYVRGELRHLTPLVDGKSEGIQTTYRDGRIRKLMELHDGKIDGVVEEYGYGRSPQVLTRRAHYRAGKLNGWERIWSLEGALLKETQYVDDKKNGVERRWEDQAAGHLDAVYHYRDGKLYGLLQEYSGGRLDEERVLGDDKRRLRRTQFWPIKGSPRKVEERIDTDEQGREQRITENFFNTGYLATRRIIFADTPHQIVTRYAGDGGIIYREEVVAGKKTGLQIDETYEGGYEWRRYDGQGRLHGEQADHRSDGTIHRWQMNHGKPVDHAAARAMQDEQAARARHDRVRPA